jgi:hypothetical protein
MTPFCYGGTLDAHRNRLAATTCFGRRRVPTVRRLRWLAVGARGSYNFAWKWGRVRHCVLRRKVAGDDAHLGAVVARGTGGAENPRCDRLRAAQGGWWPRGARRSERSPASLLGGEWEGAEQAIAVSSLERLQWRGGVLTRERKKKTRSWSLEALIACNGQGGLKAEQSLVPVVPNDRSRHGSARRYDCCVARAVEKRLSVGWAWYA